MRMFEFYGRATDAYANEKAEDMYHFPGFGTHYLSEVIQKMSPKELLYIEDALGHETFLKAQCQNAASQIQDGELKNYVTQLVAKHEELFKQFYNLV